MKETIKTISIAVVAGVLLISVGGYVAYKYFTMKSTLTQVVNIINQSLQANQQAQQTSK